MKIKSRNLLTVILAMLCAVAIALGVGFILPKNNTKTAHAATDITAVGGGDALALAVIGKSYTGLADMMNDIKIGTTLKATNFGGYVVNFGGKEWLPMYATESGGKAVLSIWLKDPISVRYPFSDGTISTESATPNPSCNDYTYSWIRAALNMGKTDLGYYYGSYSGTNQPTQYQNNVKSPSAVMAPTDFTYFADFVSGGQYSNYIETGSTGDNVWLPSGDEVKNGGIWGATSAHWPPSGFAYWTQSAVSSSYTNIGRLDTPGGLTSKPANEAYWIRPALNLDLGKLGLTVGDVEVTYNGSVRDIDDSEIKNEDKEWYDSTIMTLTYPTTGTNPMQDVGTYAVKVQLTASAITAGRQFSGDPDPTKGDGDESDTVRYFDFKINPKKLTVPTIPTKTTTYDPTNGSDFAVTGFDSTTMEAEAVPNPSTDISWVAGSTKFTATKAGTYSVKFKLQDTTNYVWDIGADGTNADQTISGLRVDPLKLNVPTITAPQEYSGSALTFVLSNVYDTATMKTDSATGTGGNTVTGAGGASVTDTTSTFEATKVGTYTVTLSLKDTTNYRWSDNSATVKDVPFEITQKELLSSPPVSSSVNGIGGAEWEFADSTVTITITDDRATGESVDLFIYYDNTTHTLTGTTVGNVTTVTMPSDIPVGTHTLHVELNGASGDNANYVITTNNTLSFEITSGVIDPTIYSWIYTKGGAAGGTSANDGSLKVPFELKAGSTVDGVKYELSIQIPTAHAGTVQVDTTKYSGGYQLRSGDKVGTYTTVVALKSIDTTFEFDVNGVKQSTIDVEFDWEIEKGTFDMSNVKWEYNLDGTTGWTEYDENNPPQYNDGNYITVRIKSGSLPNGLTLDSAYIGMEKADVDNYTATISPSDFVYNSSNFNAPDTTSLTLNWEIAKKNLFTRFKNVTEPYTNASYSGNIIIKQLDVPAGMEGYIRYEYYDKGTGLQVTLDDIKAATDPTNEKQYIVRAFIESAYAANYTVDDNGSTPSDEFTTGSSNKLAIATVDGKDGSTPITVEYDGNDHFDSSVIAVTSEDGINVTDFTVKYYKGTTATAGNELAAGELPKTSGDYCIEIILGSVAGRRYILAREVFVVTIEAKGIALPELSEMVFNGKELNFVDYLKGDGWTTYGPSGLDIIKVDGKLSDRNVGAGNYVTTLTITDSNYKWLYPSTVSPTKAIVKYSRASEVKVTGDDTTANYNWNITPLIVDTTNMWNKGKTGATLNLPQNIRDFIAGGTLELGYRYYDSDGNFIEEPELKGGKSFRVEAVFGGDDAERNIQFKRSDNEFGAVSKGIDYTVPQSGAAAFFGKVKDALTTSYLGLPLWAWLLIALALIILLIIIIVVCVKRRKTKEEKEEIKARKEEEKARREEERRLQQEKLEAERELAKAKQEAELEKIRAQAQMAAGAGMATMAVQQPQQQVPVQQVQTVDNNALARIEAEIARINEKIANQQPVQPQFMPIPVQQQMQPQYVPVPMQQQMPMMPAMMPMQMGGGMGSGEYSDLRADVRSMREEQRSDREVAALKKEMELEFAKMRADGMYGTKTQAQIAMSNMPVEQESGKPAQGNSAEVMGAIMAAFVKNIATGNYVTSPAEPVQEPQTEEKPNVANTSASYPSNAVITTTTTVDTTKNSASRGVQSDDGRLFDIDGFYDTFEGNK